MNELFLPIMFGGGTCGNSEDYVEEDLGQRRCPQGAGRRSLHARQYRGHECHFHIWYRATLLSSVAP